VRSFFKDICGVYKRRRIDVLRTAGSRIPLESRC
jgi:hypothetical protein